MQSCGRLRGARIDTRHSFYNSSMHGCALLHSFFFFFGVQQLFSNDIYRLR